MPTSDDPHRSPPWSRQAARALALALLCGALQAGLPAYTLGTAALPPLSLVLGVAAAAAMARGLAMLPAALAGVLLADVAVRGLAWPPALAGAAVLGLQAVVATWPLRQADDPGALLLDTWPRLKRLVLVAAPLAAAVGVVGGVLTGALAQAVPEGAAPQPLMGAQLAAAVGRFIADAAGVLVAAPLLLCWLARPADAWRARRRLVALPLLLVVATLLPGLHELARRDERRLQVHFDREAHLRQLRVQQLLATPMDAVLTLRGVLAAGGGTQDSALFDQLSAGWMTRTDGLRATGWIDTDPGGATPQPAHARMQAGERTPLGADQAPRGEPKAGPAAAQALSRALAQALDRPAQPVVLPLSAGAAAPQLLVLHAVPGVAGTAPQRAVFARVDAQVLLAPALPDPHDPNLRVCLVDGAAGSTAPQRLAGPARCETDALAHAVRAVPFTLALGGRRLDLLVSEPATAENRLFTAVWLLALPAVSGAALLSALLLMLSGRLRRIEDRVRERTAALQAQIDERRQAEARLAVSEQRFRAIFDSVRIGVTVVDNAGRIAEANPAFCQMMGCEATALLGRPLDEFRLPDVAEDDGTAVALGGGQARRQRYLTADGRVLQVAASLRTLHDATGAPVATVGALQDLTPVLRLREAEREREQAQIATRTKSEFLARLSHELRAPLNAILGFAQMLASTDMANDLAGSQAQRQHGLTQIRQAGWHLLDMVNDVLDLSRMEAGSLRLTLEPVALPELAQEALAMLEPAAAQAQVELRLSLSPQAEWVQADPLRLRQLLVNLLGNAVKYNRRGGMVVLRTRPAGVGELAIEVEDTGIGISEAQLGELFTPFHRLGREQRGSPGQPGSQGTGIGLVICRRLADLMGGTLEVSSREGEGSVFRLQLPRPVGAPQRTEVSDLGPLAPLGPQVSIGTVLCIEDDPADVQALRDLLAQRPGITLLCAATAADGLARAADADLVLLDLDLPDRPGITVLRALRADPRWRALPVIVVSAESRPQRIDDCFDAGASQFLTKPLDGARLLQAVDDALRG